MKNQTHCTRHRCADLSVYTQQNMYLLIKLSHLNDLINVIAFCYVGPSTWNARVLTS